MGARLKVRLRRAEKPVWEGFSGCRLLPSSASGAPLALEEWSGQSPEEEKNHLIYDSFSDVGEIRVYRRADFQSGSRVLKKVF